MGCNCSNLLGIKEDDSIENDNKVNDDFFIDYSKDNIKNIQNLDQNNDDIVNLDNEIFGSIHYSKDNTITTRNLKFPNKNMRSDNSDKNKNTINIKEKYPNNCLYRSNTNKKNKNNTNKILYSSEVDVDYITNINNIDENIDPNAKPEDNFSCILFDYINKLRTEPSTISNLIENSKQYINIEQNNEIVFKKNKVKIFLNKGISAFEETINILNKIEPMNKIIFNKNIEVELPKNEEEIENLEFLQQKVNDIEKNGNNILSYWREKITDPEIAFIIMTVDDNPIETGLKRKDLLNPNIKYIGITSINLNNNFACYITLS